MGTKEQINWTKGTKYFWDEVDTQYIKDNYPTKSHIECGKL